MITFHSVLKVGTRIGSLFWLTSQSVGINRIRTHTNKVYFAVYFNRLSCHFAEKYRMQHNFGHFFYFQEILSFYFVSEAQKFKNLLVFFGVFFEGALLKSSYLSSFNHISSQNGWFSSHLWYDDLQFRKFIRLPVFFSDFSNLSLDLQISSHNG